MPDGASSWAAGRLRRVAWSWGMPWGFLKPHGRPNVREVSFSSAPLFGYNPRGLGKGTTSVPAWPPFSTHTMTNPNAGAEPRHVSVLPAEVLAALSLGPGQVMVDATVGAGGHARLLAERLQPGGRLIGLDRDPAMLALARNRLEGVPGALVQANFDELREVLDREGIIAADGVLA